MEWKITKVKKKIVKDKEGTLTEIDVEKTSNGLFSCARRVYFICNTEKEAVRGGHWHPKNHEIITCISGKLQVILHATEEQGRCNENILLDAFNKKAVVIPAGVWHQVKFNPNSVLLAIASESFKEGESIEEMQEGCSCGKFK